MPRIRRWHPVSHDFVRDREVQELRLKYGHWMSDVWLEMLAEADKNDGVVKGDYNQISSKLSWVSLQKYLGSAAKTIRKALEFMVNLGWISEIREEFKPNSNQIQTQFDQNSHTKIGQIIGFKVSNYLNYHRHRGQNKPHQGVIEAPPQTLTLPDQTLTLPEERQKKELIVGSTFKKSKVDPSSENHQPIWPEELKEVYDTLVKLEILKFFDDPLYWKRVEEITNNTQVFYLDEIGKCVLHFSSKGNQAPRSSRGWKMAFTAWVKRALTWEDRRGAQKGFNESRSTKS